MSAGAINSAISERSALGGSDWVLGLIQVVPVNLRCDEYRERPVEGYGSGSRSGSVKDRRNSRG
jgi:hypothetical protein